jgi:drug/metabolite transporter (DMT)-like permease
LPSFFYPVVSFIYGLTVCACHLNTNTVSATLSKSRRFRYLFWIWNIAISKLGAARTILFGNLIPIFSSLGAVIFLHEQFTSNHVISMALVFTGILLANLRV